MIETASVAQWWAHALGFGLLATLACGAVLIAVLCLTIVVLALPRKWAS
ncbi:MAG: hypothetical protein QM705_04415 [Ancrocorticia sp.]